VPRRVPTRDGAGAGRREAHTAHAAGRGGAKLEGEPRAPSIIASGGHELMSGRHQAAPQQPAGQQVIFFPNPS
jgi:hypothetical protein